MMRRRARKAFAISFVVALLALPGPLTAHDAEVHDGMTRRALTRLEQDAALTPNTPEAEARRPSSVTPAEWNDYIRAARISLNKLTSQANGQKALEDILGKAATTPDDNIDDVHTFLQVTNTLPFVVLKTGSDLGWKTAIAAPAATVVLPIVCACDCILSLFSSKHKCSDCLKDTKNIIDKVPEPSDILNSAGDIASLRFTGINDRTDSAYTGLPHFINLRDGVDNDYDDHQGMYYPQAGPNGHPGFLDRLILNVVGDFAGFTINASKSQMIGRYDITDPDDDPGNGDSYQGSYSRSNMQWERYNFARTPYTPVDNLGLYGLRIYEKGKADNQSLSALGYPLHALGDATVPMHVVGTTAWGHRPFEDAYRDLWPRLSTAATVLDDHQISANAAHYYAAIKAWRANHPGTNVPIRMLGHVDKGQPQRN